MLIFFVVIGWGTTIIFLALLVGVATGTFFYGTYIGWKRKDDNDKLARNNAFMDAVVALDNFLFNDAVDVSNKNISAAYLLSQVLIPLGLSGRSVEELIAASSSVALRNWNTNFPAVDSVNNAIEVRLTNKRQEYIDRLVRDIREWDDQARDYINLKPFLRKFDLLGLWARENEGLQKEFLQFEGKLYSSDLLSQFEIEVHGKMARVLIFDLIMRHDEDDYESLKISDLEVLRDHIGKAGGVVASRIDRQFYDEMVKVVMRRLQIPETQNS